MATWQYRTWATPSSAPTEGATIDSSAELWAALSPSVAIGIFDASRLLRGPSWSPKNLHVWGAPEGNSVSVFTDEGQISTIEVAFDANDRAGTFVAEVCLCLRQLDAKLIDHDARVILPEPALVATAIATSNAAKFVADPLGYLDSLKTRT